MRVTSLDSYGKINVPAYRPVIVCFELEKVIAYKVAIKYHINSDRLNRSYLQMTEKVGKQRSSWKKCFADKSKLE